MGYLRPQTPSKMTITLIVTLLGIVILLGLSACSTNYVTKEGQRLLGNTAAGCILGEVAFGKCEEGAAIGAFTTVITDQKK
tara:strand:+ start:409 stop:651 length:243 start_codon:yes stop_codon:yes gene_type:complete